MPANQSPIGGGGSPKAAPKLTNVQRASSAIGAAKAVAAAPKLALPGPGVSKVGAAAENIGAAKRLTLPDIKSYSPPKPTSPRGDEQVFEAAIKNFAPTSLIPGAAGIGVNLGKDIVNLPTSTLEGATQVGGSVAKSISEGSPSPFLHELGAAARGDALFNLLTGHLGRAAQLAATHPLGAALDLTGAYGVAGRGLGLGMRAAGADSAALGGREEALVSPGLASARLARGYSPNYLTALAQKAGDRLAAGDHASPLMKRALATKAAHDLRLQIASTHAAKQGELASEESHIMKSLTAGKPAGKEEAAIAPLVALTGGGRDLMHAIYDRMLRGDIPHDPDAVASRARMLTDLHAMALKDAQGKFDWGTTQKAAAAYKPMADLQEVQKAIIDGRDVNQMARHLDNVRALREPDVHYLDTPVTDPRKMQDLKDAKAAQREAAANLKLAERNQAAYSGTPEARGAYRGASNAVSQLTKAIPVDPLTDTLMNKALDLRQMLDDQHPHIKALHKTEIKLRREELANAKRATAEARAAVKKQPIQGTVIEDPNVPQLRSGLLKNLSVRPLTAEDAAAIRRGERLTKNGPVRVGSPDPAAELQSYVSSRNPDRPSAQSTYRALSIKSGDELLSPAERGAAPYTGESLNVGDMRSGWSALPNTLLSNARRLSEAKETHDFFDRFELKNQNLAGSHEPWATLADAKRAANDYEQAHGLKMSVLEDRNGQYHVMPKVAVRELNRQRSLDHPGTAAKFLTTPNRIFRETVLPYSPKLPVMHTVENVSRTLLNSKGNPLRIAGNLRLQRAVEDAMTPSARERLTALATQGSLSRSGVAGEAEDMGHLVTDETPMPKAAIQRVTHFMSGVSTTIIRGQRALELPAQRAALGEHARTLLGEFGTSYRAAKAEMDTYAAKLADKLATPADAERAAQAVHDAVGKYNAFTANTRLALRVMPFGAWYINAARLIFAVLPRDHPLFDALLQDTHTANQQSWNAQHRGLPGDLQSSLPVGNSAYLDIGKLTPIGLPGQSPATTMAQLTLPEYSGSLMALAGAKDPFGADLKGPDTGYGQAAYNSIFSGKSPVAWGPALEQIGEAMGGPLNDIARALYGHGGVLYNESTPVLHLASAGQLGKVEVKPGSTQDQKGILNLPGPLDKVFDPFHPTTYHTSGSTLDTSKLLGRAVKPVGRLAPKAIGGAPKLEGK